MSAHMRWSQSLSIVLLLVGLLALAPHALADPGGPVATVDSTADVTISKADTADPVTVGETFNYTLLVTNAGSVRANDVVVKDALPAGVTFVSASGASCSESGGVVTCTRNNLNAGGSFTINIAVDAVTAGSWTNNANVTTTTAESSTANNADSEETTIRTAAPTGLTCVATSSGVDLDWDDVAQATGYKVYRRTGESGDFVLLATTSASQHLDSTAAVGQSYTYRITSLSAGGESLASEQCTVASVPEFSTVLAGALALAGSVAALVTLRRWRE